MYRRVFLRWMASLPFLPKSLKDWHAEKESLELFIYPYFTDNERWWPTPDDATKRGGSDDAGKGRSA